MFYFLSDKFDTKKPPAKGKEVSSREGEEVLPPIPEGAARRRALKLKSLMLALAACTVVIASLLFS